MISKALLIPNITRNVLCGGLVDFMTSSTFCVRLVRRVIVECGRINPCFYPEIQGECEVLLNLG